jgi:hypothetical protein
MRFAFGWMGTSGHWLSGILSGATFAPNFKLGIRVQSSFI